LLFSRLRYNHCNIAPSQIIISAHALKGEFGGFLGFHSDPAFATEVIPCGFKIDVAYMAKLLENINNFCLCGIWSYEVDV
jgi:hypothetical protein